MIDKSMDILQKVIQKYLSYLSYLDMPAKDYVVMSPVVKADGSIAIPDSYLGLSLVRIEEERIVKSQNSYSISQDGQVSKFNPEIKLNLYILITANFSDYGTSLKFLSAVVKCFQSKNVFTPSNTPEMDPFLQKLIVELYTLNFEEQNHLWGALGAKYNPSLLYRVRLITLQEEQKLSDDSSIKKVEISSGSV